MLADHLARRWGLSLKREGNARVAQGRVLGQELRLIKPWTYMNRSGAALAPLRSLPGFDPAADLLVLVDDYAFATGTFKLRGAGGTGGHNGLKSIEGALQRQDYARLRIGIGPLPPDWNDPADFVLGPLEPEELAAIQSLLDPMAEAVECWMDEGIEKAMSRFNKS